MTRAMDESQEELQGFRRVLGRDLKPVLVVAVLAAVVRGLYLVQLSGTPFPHHLIMDAAGYDRWALQIAAGNWLGDKVFYQEPLYPYILALIHLAFGQGLLAVYVVQGIAGVLNCVLVQVLSARVVENRWAGVMSGLVLAFYGPMVFYESQVLKTVWTVLLLLVLLHVLLSAWERRSPALWGLGGLVLAFLGLVQGNMLLAAPFVLVWVVLACRGWGWARLSASLFLVVVGLVLPLGAAMTRNYLVGGDVVLSSSHAGFNFYIGNHKGADGAYQYHPGVREDPVYEGEDARVLASRTAGRDLRPSEASAYWFREAVSSFRDDPAEWLRLEAIKLARFVNAEEVMDTWSVGFLAEHAWLLHAAFFSYALLLPGGLVGFIIFLRRGPRAHLINLMIVATTFSVVVFYVLGRYRMPVAPLFAVAWSAVVVEFAGWVRRGEYEKPILVVLGVALATWGELVTIHGNTLPAEYRAAELCNLAVLYEVSDKPALARQEYDRALEASPRFSRALSSLGVLDFSGGKTESAGRFFRDAIQADALNAGAHYGLAGVYYREGKRQDAIQEMKAAINARPAYFDAYRDLGATLLETRDYAQARGVLEEALRLNPGSETIWKNLGTCYYELRDFEKARASWRKALEMTDTPEEKARLLRNLSLPGVVLKP